MDYKRPHFLTLTIIGDIINTASERISASIKAGKTDREMLQEVRTSLCTVNDVVLAAKAAAIICERAKHPPAEAPEPAVSEAAASSGAKRWVH